MYPLSIRGEALLGPAPRPKLQFLFPLARNDHPLYCQAYPAHTGDRVCMRVRRQARKARERLTAFFRPLLPCSVGDTGKKRAADPGLNLECSLIRYYAICSRTLSPSNAAANLLSSPN